MAGHLVRVRSTWSAPAVAVVLSASALLLAGCSLGGSPATDKDSLVRRVSAGLDEVGASPPLTRCLTKDLGDHLTEADAEAAYEDLASDPEVSESSLNRVSLAQNTVRERLVSRARVCRFSLVAAGIYSRGEMDRMLRRVGVRGYRRPGLFLVRN
ncbi:MAG: hypothetical protein ACTHKT_06965 [Solirubrobacterales bacterium]